MKSLVRSQPLQEFDSLQSQMDRMFENGAESPRRAEYNYFGRTCLLPSENNLSTTEFGPPVDIYEDDQMLRSRRSRHKADPGSLTKRGGWSPRARCFCGPSALRVASSAALDPSHLDAMRCRGQLVLVQILTGNIVLKDLLGMHFPRVFIAGFLYARHSAGLKNVSFFYQFIDAFRVRLRHPGQTF